ncbi:hypothetical protein J4408_01640 [Candidatus Pacearchaeota archaeon]|nr:hypothetical protein [Candidatus Pacearchaeota archaeon]
MESKNNDYEEKLTRARSYKDKYMPQLPYHNKRHADDVEFEFTRLATLEGISQYDINIGRSAAIGHDLVQIVGDKYNEEKTANLIMVTYPLFGYTLEETKRIAEMIPATKMPSSPKNHLEQILCDADIANLGRLDFLERNTEVKAELGVKDDYTWYIGTLKFLENTQFYTASARKLYGEQREKNIAYLKEIINKFPR